MQSARIILFSLALFLLAMTSSLTVTSAQAAGPRPVVLMETSMGRIIVQLYSDKTPATVKNFLRYVDKGFYNGTIFHRVIKQGTAENPGKGMNIVQGGGFDQMMIPRRALWPAIVNEDLTGLSNDRGTIAMARTSDPDSATCQFFFNVYDNPALNPALKANTMGSMSVTRHGYCAFGKVIRGLDVLEAILKVKTGRHGLYSDVPVKPVLLKKVYRPQ